MHLLVETAIMDSANYEILSYEEVDDLKKEYSLLANRISASKRKLALESKVREAAISLSRLYSPKSKSRQRRSLIGTNANNTNNNISPIIDVVRQADDELATSTRKCEELAIDIWKLNNRAGDIQRRLLQHSSGVLGMTHHDNLRITSHGSDTTRQYPRFYGQNSGSNLSSPTLGGFMADEFDERSFYKTPDKLDDITDGMARSPKYYGLGFQRASRSPIEVSRGANDHFVSPSNYPYLKGKRSSSAGSLASPDGLALAFMERRVVELNTNIRNFLIQAGVQIPTSPSSPQAVPLPSVGVNGERTSTGRPLSNSSQALGGSPVFVLQEQLSVLEKGIKQIENTALISTNQSSELVKRLERTETILGSLWEVLLMGEEELRYQKRDRQRRRDRRAQLADSGQPDEDLDGLVASGEDDEFEETDDEDETATPPEDDQKEDFTISTFSGKLHNLYERATRLHAERTSLRKHLAEQRNVYFDKMRAMRDENERKINDLTNSLNSVQQELVSSTTERGINGTNLELQLSQALNQLQLKEDESKRSEEDITDLMQQLQKAHEDLHDKDNQLVKSREVEFNISAQTEQRNKAEEMTKDIQDMQQKLEEANYRLQESNQRIEETEEKANEITQDADQRVEQIELKVIDLETDLREASAVIASTKERLREKEEMSILLQSLVTELEEKKSK